MFFAEVETPIGKLTIYEQNGKIVRLCLPNDNPVNGAETADTPLLNEAITQMIEYFAGSLTQFSLPINPSGTEFQRRAWQALVDTQYGNTASYSDIAVAIGSEKACRAVGLANNRNPIPIIIPCHRVVGKSGKLVGFRGGLEMKQWLLDHEKIHVNNMISPN